MGTWGLRPISLAGIALTDAERTAYFLRGMGALDGAQHTPVSVERLAQYPAYVRTQPGDGKVFPVTFILEEQTQEVLQTLRQMMDPQHGSAVLEVDDRDGVRKQVTVVRQGLRLAGINWVAPLWAADPRLEAVSLSIATIDDLTGTSGQTFTPQPANVGDTEAFPLIKIESQSAKFATNSWTKTREITFAWRSDFAADWLLELTNAGLNTSTLIDTSGTSTLLNEGSGISSGATPPFTITVDSTASFPDEGMLLVTAGGDEEQMEYSILSGTVFTITARGLGGVTARSHIDNAVIHLSQMLLNGDDIAVLIDGVQVPGENVYINGIDTSTTKIWIPLSDGPARYATLVNAPGASGTSFILDTAAHGFVVGDYVVVKPSGAWETCRVSAVSGETVTVVRGVRGTSSTAISTTAQVYRQGHRIQLVYNWSGAPSRPPLMDVPLIDLALSTNLKWVWTTAPFWQDDDNKRGGWQRSTYDGPSAIPGLSKNRRADFIGLDVDGSNQARWTDSRPVAARPGYDSLIFYAACGIKASTASIEFDASVSWPFALQLIGRDLRGNDILLGNYMGHETGESHLFPFPYTNEQYTPLQTLQTVVLRARNVVVTHIVTGNTAEGIGQIMAVGEDAQSFILDDATRLDGIVLRLEQTGTSRQVFVILTGDNSGEPGDLLAGAYMRAITDTSPADYCFHETAGFVVLPSGTYHIVPYTVTGSEGDVSWMKALRSLYARGHHSEITTAPSTWTQRFAEDMWFAILSLIADNQPEVQDTGEEMWVNNLELTFDSADMTPVAVSESPVDGYLVDDAIQDASGNILRVTYYEQWADIQNIELQIDCAAKTVKHMLYEDSIISAIAASSDDWLVVPAGTADVTVTPQGGGCQDELVTLEWRSLWQA